MNNLACEKYCENKFRELVQSAILDYLRFSLSWHKDINFITLRGGWLVVDYYGQTTERDEEIKEAIEQMKKIIKL